MPLVAPRSDTKQRMPALVFAIETGTVDLLQRTFDVTVEAAISAIRVLDANQETSLPLVELAGDQRTGRDAGCLHRRGPRAPSHVRPFDLLAVGGRPATEPGVRVVVVNVQRTSPEFVSAHHRRDVTITAGVGTVTVNVEPALVIRAVDYAKTTVKPLATAAVPASAAEPPASISTAVVPATTASALRKGPVPTVYIQAALVGTLYVSWGDAWTTHF